MHPPERPLSFQRVWASCGQHQGCHLWSLSRLCRLTSCCPHVFQIRPTVTGWYRTLLSWRDRVAWASNKWTGSSSSWTVTTHRSLPTRRLKSSGTPRHPCAYGSVTSWAIYSSVGNGTVRNFTELCTSMPSPCTATCPAATLLVSPAPYPYLQRSTLTKDRTRSTVGSVEVLSASDAQAGHLFPSLSPPSSSPLWVRVSLCSTCLPGVYYVAQSVLELNRSYSFSLWNAEVTDVNPCAWHWGSLHIGYPFNLESSILRT